MKPNLRQKTVVLLATALSAVLVFPAAAASVALTTLHSFGVYTNGAAPYCVLARGNDGNFYGTTFGGGTNNAGTVFQVTTKGALTEIYSFTNGLDGSSPQAGLVLGSDGSFYGTAEGGGSNNTGTVYRITPAGSFTALYSFSATDVNGNNPDGAEPVASLAQGSGGLLYGTAYAGGSNGWGAVFQISTNGAFSALYSFAGGDDGALPAASLEPGNDGFLYGTATSGGSGGYGSIFKLASSATFTALYSFTNGTDGASPKAGLALGQDGALYGTASEGGANGRGTVFSITSSGAFSPLYSFANGKDGGAPVAALIQGSDLNFYGTSTGPSSGFGTIFKITSSGDITPLYSFTGKADGAYPQAGLAQNTDGTLYGAAASGGTNGAGTLFSVTTNGALTPLVSFVGGFDGENPLAPVIQGGDGNFYGTTYYGGSNDQGVVFQMSPSGDIMARHSFTNGIDGSGPLALAPANDGSFYGTTASGGANFVGAAFHFIINGAFAPVHSFKSQIDGSDPLGGLVQGSDGSFYGTTKLGGSNFGTVFRMTAAGAVTLLHAFTNGIDGANPVAPLVQGKDGNFYGTTYAGGSNGFGGVFEISSNGASFTPLYAFTNGADGARPEGGLVQGIDGAFYGTTYLGGLTSNGVIFKITSAGSFTPLYSFSGGNDGANPAAGLMLGADTNFYGTTYNGGAYTWGAVFNITPGGAFTALYSFTGGNDGANPAATLTPGNDGSIYGTTYAGVGTVGTVFRLTGLRAVAPVLLSIVSTPPGIVLTWSTVPGQFYQLQFASSLSPANWANVGNSVYAFGETASETNLFPFNSPRFYRVSGSLPAGP